MAHWVDDAPLLAPWSGWMAPLCHPDLGGWCPSSGTLVDHTPLAPWMDHTHLASWVDDAPLLAPWVDHTLLAP
jgi:hypothetical protein